MEVDRGINSDDNGRDTPKESYELPTRIDTPGPIPKYMYSRDKLMDLSTCRLAKERPPCLSKDHCSPEGIWEPERWFRSFDTSRGNSPLMVGDKKRPPDLDRDYINRRRPSDPKERLKDDKDGIVLSPQRRSFGTGCHVSNHVPLGRQISIPGQENGEKERNPRRIGSGRIQIDRDREREPAHQERDFRAIRDRFDREDRRFDNRDNRNYGRREFEDRNYRERGHYNNNRNRRDSYRNRNEEEPEWFTEGPTSQHDRIELHGFEQRSNSTPDKEDENWRQAERQESRQEIKKGTPHKEEDEETNHRRESVANVTDRNGSLETNEPSSPEESNNSDSINVQSPRHNNLFDFNEFFKLENLPGLHEGASPSTDFTGLQSRFSKWFSNSSRDNSRRSSINEDFGYLNDLLSGSKSPVVPSPPPPSANSFSHQSVFSTSANSTFQDKPQQLSYDFSSVQKNTIGPMLNALFQNSSHDRSHRSSTSSMTAQDAEAQLKALLFGRKGSTPSSSGTGSPAVASPLHMPGRFKTVAELEADMAPNNNRTYTPPGAPIQHPLVTQPAQQKASKPPPPAQSPKEQQDDLAAFNKLLSLMQAGAAAAVESPNKMSQTAQRNPEQRTMSPIFLSQPPPSSNNVPPPGQPPLTPGSVAQNEFLQALLRNKEQQLQIRQHTLNHMRGSVHLNNQSTPIAQQAQNFQQTPPSGGGPPPPRHPDNSETLANFIKQNPTIITKPSTPTPPPQQPPPPMPPVPAVHSPLAPHPGQAAVIGLMQNTPSPRAASPQLIQQALLAQPGSPRVPSPIMFSQQPPMHLSAPSPIHPSQIAGKSSPVSMQAATNLSSTGTATIRPPLVPRVPSPQELIAHTQAIMQTALLKKQLEDQKERFIKKQQERGKSPNPTTPQGKVAAPPGQQQPSPASPRLVPSGPLPASSLPQPLTPQSTPSAQSMPGSKPSVTASFTPTSVIRKMHSDKASEKEKQRGDGPRMEGADGDKKVPPVKQLVRSEEGRELQGQDPRRPEQNVFDFRTLTNPSQVSVCSSHPSLSVGPGTVSTSQPSISSHNHMPNLSIPPPSLANQSGLPSLANQNSPQFSRNNSIDQQQMAAVDQVAALQAMMAADRLKQQPQVRPVMGTPLSSSVAMQSAGRPIVKGVNMNSSFPQQNQAHLKMMSPQISNPNMVKPDLQTPPQRPIVGSGTTPISSASVDLSKVLQQRHVISPNPMTRPSMGTPQGLPMGIPITGRLPLQPPVSVGHNPLLMQQVMQGNLSQTTVRVNTLNQMGHLNQMAMQAQHQRIVDPRLQGIRGVYTPPVSGVAPRGMGGSPLMNRTLTPGKQVLNGPISPNSGKGNEPNLMKWFGTDVLKTSLPHMPPIPTQGQRVMTVDEIERHTQAVSN